MKYKAVATNGAAAMQHTTNADVRKIKNISLAVFQCVFWVIYRSQTEVVLK